MFLNNAFSTLDVCRGSRLAPTDPSPSVPGSGCGLMSKLWPSSPPSPSHLITSPRYKLITQMWFCNAIPSMNNLIPQTESFALTFKCLYQSKGRIRMKSKQTDKESLVCNITTKCLLSIWNVWLRKVVLMFDYKILQCNRGSIHIIQSSAYNDGKLFI